MTSSDGNTSQTAWQITYLVMAPGALQEDANRAVRMRQAQVNNQIDDETLGSQQANSLLELIRSGDLNRRALVQNKRAKAAAEKACCGKNQGIGPAGKLSEDPALPAAWRAAAAA